MPALPTKFTPQVIVAFATAWKENCPYAVKYHVVLNVKSELGAAIVPKLGKRLSVKADHPPVPND